MLYPAVFVIPSHEEIMQFELGRLQVCSIAVNLPQSIGFPLIMRFVFAASFMFSQSKIITMDQLLLWSFYEAVDQNLA